MRIKYFGHLYHGEVVGGRTAIAHILKIGRKRAWVEFHTKGGRHYLRQVRIVHTQTEMDRAGFACVLIPLDYPPPLISGVAGEAQ